MPKTVTVKILVEINEFAPGDGRLQQRDYATVDVESEELRRLLDSRSNYRGVNVVGTLEW